MSVPLESSISAACIKKARAMFLDAIVIRKRNVTMGVMGDPDVYGSLYGLHFEVEVKRPGKVPTDLQERRLAEWKAAGAIAGVATSVEEFIAILLAGLHENRELCQ
jgi:hypothetical protein